MFKQLMRAFFPLLILAVAPCEAVQQFVRVDTTMMLKTVDPGSAPVFLGDSSAVATFESLTRKALEQGIESNPNANSLFTADPVVLNLKVVRAYNPASDTMAVTYTTTFRITSSRTLIDNDFLLRVKWNGYYTMMQSAQLTLALAEAIPLVFDDLIGFSLDFSIAKEVSDPNAPIAPIAPPPVRPPTTRPVPRPPTTRPTLRPTPRPAPRPTCRNYWQICSSNAQCCSQRCNLTAGRCERRV
jgi:hypothetical protein